MFYIHETACISAQQSFMQINLDQLRESVNNQLKVIEPEYQGIPSGLIRRMGKAVKMGVGSALSLLRQGKPPHGIIIGTANGGMEDCIKFLNQIIEYDEGILAPGNFVQSTTNAIASQLGLLTANKSYNITHAHRGLAFENAIIDASMLVKENPSHEYLLGAVDEISSYNYNIDFLDGWYKKQPSSNLHLYDEDSDGSLAGEGATMFLVSGQPASAIGRLKAVQFIHTEDESKLSTALKRFIEDHAEGQVIDILISGENGDRRFKRFYEVCEAQLDDQTAIARFKHMSGEFPTASAMAVWLGCYAIRNQHLPEHMIKRKGQRPGIKNLLIYNNFKKTQHSFMLLSQP